MALLEDTRGSPTHMGTNALQCPAVIPLVMLGYSVWYLHLYPTDHLDFLSPSLLTVVKDFLFDKDLMLSARSSDAVQDKCP